MMRLIFTILIAALLLELDACCTKKGCTGFGYEREIQFQNFAASDTGNIIIEVFEGNSNFTNRIDSSSGRIHSVPSNTFLIAMPENISTSHDYQITFSDIRRAYKLTDIKTRSEPCNCPGDQYTVLDSYFINGEKQEGPLLTIMK